MLWTLVSELACVTIMFRFKASKGRDSLQPLSFSSGVKQTVVPLMSSVLWVCGGFLEATHHWAIPSCHACWPWRTSHSQLWIKQKTKCNPALSSQRRHTFLPVGTNYQKACFVPRFCGRSAAMFPSLRWLPVEKFSF